MNRFLLCPVCRQGFWAQWRPELSESLAHLVGLIMRRVSESRKRRLRGLFLLLTLKAGRGTPRKLENKAPVFQVQALLWYILLSGRLETLWGSKAWRAWP